MKPVTRAWLELHIAVVLFGFTAILGKLIELDAVVLVWWRVFFTALSLLFLIQIRHVFFEMPRRVILRFMGIGVLVGLHWVTFFAAIHWSNASVCLVAMATASLFTAVLEPLLLRQKVKWFEIMLGTAIIPGLFLIADNVSLSMHLGLGVGLVSAFLMALFGILNKKLIHTADSLSITFLELGSAWLFLSLIVPVYFYFNGGLRFLPSFSELGYLLILALVCTTLGYVLALRALKHLSAFASNLTIHLEPVYGIILAILILKENRELPLNFYWGVLIILGAVFLYPLLKNRFAPDA